MENRRWMRDPSKHSEEYIRGVKEFIEFAFQNSEINGKIWCPCTVCANCKSRSRTSVYEHLTDPRRGFLRGYKRWIFHGERPTTSSSTMERHSGMGHGMDGLNRDVFAMHPTGEPSCGEDDWNPEEAGENVKYKEDLNKHNNEVGTSQTTQTSKCHMPWKDDIYSQVLGPEKRGRVHIGKIPKPKKAKVVLSENQLLRDRVKQMENLLAKVMTFIQNRFSGEDVNYTIQAARQVTDASSVTSEMNSPSSDTNEDNGANED